MKTKILLFVVLFSLTAFPQIIEGPYFNELKGMEDKNGNTHLFYRLYNYEYRNDFYYETKNNIWHFDLSTKKDTFFLPTSSFKKAFSEGFYTTSNFNFWNSDPAQFISSGIAGGIDGNGFVLRYDMSAVKYFNSFFPADKVFISPENDSLVLVSCQPWYKSNDKGITWSKFNSFIYGDQLLGIHAKKDSVLFYIRDNILYKSKDLGLHSIKIDTSFTPIRSEPIFDADKKHVYFWGLTQNGYNALFVSDNEGEPGSLRECYENHNKFLLSVDASKPGCIYICDGYYLYSSNDFGKTFNLVKSFKNKIIGIYKKPNSEKLYAADKYTIFEINNDKINEIKRLPYPQHLFSYYPLAAGNKWVYKIAIEFIGKTIKIGTRIREVTGDTLLENGKKYFRITEINKELDTATTICYERIDSTSGIVYRFSVFAQPSKEVAIRDLKASDGDTASVIFYPDSAFSSFQCRYFQTTKWDVLTNGMRFWCQTLGQGAVQYELLKNFGEVNSIIYRDGPVYSFTLDGCRINGVVYGDTTVTSVRKESILPGGYALYQNYPNPFNPSTVIKYSLPNEEKVSLCIYNILGQKVKALVDEIKTAGEHEVIFDARDLPSGVYFCKINTPKFTNTKKLVLIK